MKKRKTMYRNEMNFREGTVNKKDTRDKMIVRSIKLRGKRIKTWYSAGKIYRKQFPKDLKIKREGRISMTTTILK